MHMNIPLSKLLVCHARQLRMSLYILVRDSRRLLHHISKITGHCKHALSGAHRTLDKENLAAHRSPGKTCNHTRSLITLLKVMRIGRQTEVLAKMLRLD